MGANRIGMTPIPAEDGKGAPDEVESFVRTVAYSLPPSDFGSFRAIKAMAAAIREREKASRLKADAAIEALREVFDRDLCFDGPNILIRCDSHGAALGLANRVRALLSSIEKPHGG